MNRYEQVHPHNLAARRVPLALAPLALSRADRSGPRGREGSEEASPGPEAVGGTSKVLGSRGRIVTFQLGLTDPQTVRHRGGRMETEAAGRAFAKAQRPCD